MTDYNRFASTFAASRQSLVWPEIDYILALSSFQNPPLSVLDVGCGSGRFLTFLEKKNTHFSYLGIDASSAMIEESKKAHPHRNFLVCDMQDIETMDSQFDCIVFLASFHHLKNYEERLDVLKKTKKILAPGGIVAMTNWNLLGTELFPKYEKSHRWNGEFDIKIGAHARYYHGFTTEELGGLFTETGYDILENRVFTGGKNILSILGS